MNQRGRRYGTGTGGRILVLNMLSVCFHPRCSSKSVKSGQYITGKLRHTMTVSCDCRQIGRKTWCPGVRPLCTGLCWAAAIANRPGQTSIMMGPSVDEDGNSELDALTGPRQGRAPALSRTPGVETLSPLPGEDVHPPQPKPGPHTNPSQQGARSSGLRRPPERRQKPEVVDPPPPAPEVRKPRRVERHPKSIIFGEWDIRYIESPPVNQFRAFCSGHAEDGTDELKCTKSMRVNQGSSEEAVARRLKAWLLEGKACNSRLDHMFYTMVPSEESAGTDAELDARLG